MTFSWASILSVLTMLLTLLSPVTSIFGVKPMVKPVVTATDDAIVQTVDVLSFNILYGGDGQRAMQPRQNAVVQTIRSAFSKEEATALPDSFGLQEVTPEWLASLEAIFPEYGVVSLGRDADNLGEANPIFYLKDKFTLLDSGTFWLSDTPEQLSNTWNASCNRICTWAILEDVQTGFQYAHFNTHLDVSSAKAREKGAELIVKQISALVPSTTGVVVTGDFNANVGEKPYQILTKNGFYDTKSVADEAFGRATYHNFVHKDWITLSPIDYVFASKHVRNVASYKVITDKADGIYPSDHYPVAVRLTLAQQTVTQDVTRIMSFNVLTGGDGEKENTHRVQRVANTIEMVKPDSFGVQEAHLVWIMDLKNNLPQYDYVGVGRTNGGLLGEFSAVFYLKEKYKVVNSGTFWISETPEKASVGWDAALPRICTWAILENKETGKQYAHFNTHLDHVGVEARVQGVELMRERAAGLDIPVVITGDFNVSEGSEPHATMIKDTFGDAKLLAADTVDGGTFHNYGTPGSKPIDFVFFTKSNVTAVKYRILNQPMLGGLPSDHFPIYTDLQLLP